MAKRVRTPLPKAGVLQAVWGRPDPWNDPDVCFVWGFGCQRADAHLLHSAFQYQSVSEISGPVTLPFLKELEKRGYDLTTLKFSIRKKAIVER